MQQAIEEAKKMIEEINREKDGYYDTKKDRINLLVELINRLESLPKEPTLEELLENMPTKRNNANLHLYLDGEWCAEYMYEMDSGMIDIGGYGTTPRLALIELKEKLSTNQ